MSAEQIVAALTLIMSLAFDLVPKLKDWWAALEDETKRAAWLVGCTVIPGALWLSACFAGFDPFGFAWKCGADGLVALLVLVATAYGLSQGSHSIVKLAKSILG